MERLVVYMIIGVILWAVVTILLVYSKNYFFDRLIKLTKEQKELEKERRKNNSSKADSYYLECKNLFNNMMKGGILKREKILELKDLIDLCLGDKIKYYKNYQFKNDCMEIYTKLKSENLNQLDYQKIIKFLKTKDK